MKKPFDLSPDDYKSLVQLVGIAGPAGAGKTTLAQRIAQAIAFSCVASFAARIKQVACSIGWDGKKDARGRRLLQILGTETAREYNPDVWVDILFRQIEDQHAANLVDVAIIDDVRFSNEVARIRKCGGLLIKLTGRGYDLPPGKPHISEQPLDDALFDVVLDNSGDIQELRKFAIKTAARLEWQRENWERKRREKENG